MSIIDTVRDPIPGETISPSWARDVVRAIRASKVLAGPGVRVDYGPQGQRVRTVGAAAAGGVAAATEEMWTLSITKDGANYTATVSNMYAGIGTAHDNLNAGEPASVVLSGTAGDVYLGAAIDMETHFVTLIEASTFNGIVDLLPDKGSVIVKLPLYKLSKSESGGYRKVMRLWDRPCIAWYE